MAQPNIAMWTEAAQALLRAGNGHLAGPLLEEAVAEANRWQKPFGHAMAYTYRAVYRVEIGKRTEALADLREVRAAIAQLEPGNMRDYVTYRMQIAEGLCAMADSPARAAELLQSGLEGQIATGTFFDAITYTTEVARAQLDAGQLAAGAATLERAIAIFENIRSTVEDPVSRMLAFRQAQPAFNRLIELRVTSLPDDEEAFRLTERSRARVLLETADTANSNAFATSAEVEKALPENTALVSYVILEDRVLAWVIERGHSRRVTLPGARPDLREAIERFRLELAQGDDVTSIHEAAAPLYDTLIRPLGLAPGNQSLIVVPDQWLGRLPFAALFDSWSGRYLIEQRTVTVAPSATLLLRRASTHRKPNARALKAVVFAVSQAGSHRGQSLPPLVQAEREAEAVAAMYPGSTLMIGTNATREDFLRLSVSPDVVHFAGHAVVDLNAPRRSVLLFAGPSRSLEPLSFGELLDAGAGTASLVVLSACHGQDSLADEREGLLGLAGAFVAAGVREVVASPLAVDDELAPRVMAAFHRHYRKHGSARVAYREAVLELLQRGANELRSPTAWGGFSVIEGQMDKGGLK